MTPLRSPLRDHLPQQLEKVSASCLSSGHSPCQTVSYAESCTDQGSTLQGWSSLDDLSRQWDKLSPILGPMDPMERHFGSNGEQLRQTVTTSELPWEGLRLLNLYHSSTSPSPQSCFLSPFHKGGDPYCSPSY